MRNDTCKYCGKIGVHGMGCLQSPTGYHEEVGDADHCVFCGSTNYGYGCLLNPYKQLNGLHIHGHGKADRDGRIHCVYCGEVLSTSTGKGQCLLSPTKNHLG